jgi:hypothetical protein
MFKHLTFLLLVIQLSSPLFVKTQQSYKKKVIVNNSTNMNKTNNCLSLRIIGHKTDHDMYAL